MNINNIITDAATNLAAAVDETVVVATCKPEDLPLLIGRLKTPMAVKWLSERLRNM